MTTTHDQNMLFYHTDSKIPKRPFILMSHSTSIVFSAIVFLPFIGLQLDG